MPLLKICGNHYQQDIDLISRYLSAIDYIGFIFTPISKRYVTPEQVAIWVRDYPFLKEKGVAVFLDQPLAEIKEVLNETGLQHVQLHGSESVQDCMVLRQEVGVSVWKVIAVQEGQTGNWQPYAQAVNVLLLDTKVKGQSGGTGLTFDWRVITEMKKETQKLHIPLWVAGGISPDNVGQLISSYLPDGIDLAGGVEGPAGKDEKKLKNIIERIGINER
jgi:phosphoribosylanthranilate isomerase